MYGVMAGQKSGGGGGGSMPSRSQHREQTAAAAASVDEHAKNRGLKEKFVQYMKRRLNPPAEDPGWLDEAGCGLPPRHRPEPPAALAAATRFTQYEIKLMYRGFKQECPTGVVDEEVFKKIFAQFFPLGDASQYAHLVFNSIKHKHSDTVNFEELLSCLSLLARGTVQERVTWLFALYDADGDGSISRADLNTVVQAVYELLGSAAAPPVHRRTAADHADRIFHLMDTERSGAVSLPQLARWCSSRETRRSMRTLDTVL